MQNVVKAHNNFSYKAWVAGADPNDAYDESNKALQFELREEVGRKIAHQNAVVERNQKNVQDNEHFGPTLDEKTLEEEATGHNTAER